MRVTSGNGNNVSRAQLESQRDALEDQRRNSNDAATTAARDEQLKNVQSRLDAFDNSGSSSTGGASGGSSVGAGGASPAGGSSSGSDTPTSSPAATSTPATTSNDSSSSGTDSGAASNNQNANSGNNAGGSGGTQHVPGNYGQGPSSVSSSEPVQSNENGDGWERHGPLRRGSEYQSADPLNQFREQKGNLDPNATPGLLTNPYRNDGTAKSPNYDTNATGLYTEGNKWQNSQGQIVDGQQGVATLNNKTDQQIIVTGGMIPGNEQPGAAMTVVKPGESGVQAPRPPEGERQPEIYASVGNLDPTDGIGWHQSERRPANNPSTDDYGTPGYAYKTDVIGNNGNVYAGLSTNEGYDPALSQKPGYGVALYGKDGQTGERSLLGVTDVVYNGGNTAQARLWADPSGNPSTTEPGVTAQFGQGQINGGTFEYEFVSPEAANQLINERRSANPSGYVERTVQSTPES